MNNFWNNRRVLITGHTGFKGVWLSKWLDMLGAHTMGYSLPPDNYSLYDKICFSANHQSLYADVRDRVSLTNAIREFEPEIIFHLAAQAIVETAREKPAVTFETNVMGTVNLLEAVRNAPCVKSIIVITSDKVYDNIESYVPYIESDRLGGSEPYSASKACEELAVLAYRNVILSTKTIGIATARASNVYGGGDLHYDRLIPYLIHSKIQNTKVAIRNPEAVRPWQYVLSPIYGYMLLAEALYHEPDKYSEAFNFGPPEDELVTVGELSSLIAGTGNITVEKRSLHEAGLLLINSMKSCECLGWKPILDLRSGLDRTELFYREIGHGKNVTELFEREIEKFI